MHFIFETGNCGNGKSSDLSFPQKIDAFSKAIKNRKLKGVSPHDVKVIADASAPGLWQDILQAITAPTCKTKARKEKKQTKAAGLLHHFANAR